MSIGIIGAMESEVRALQAAMSDKKYTEYAGMRFCEGLLHSVNVVCVQCGIGKVNAALCVQILKDRFNAECIINTGVAGALSDELDIGDIVISSEAVQHDFDLSPIGYQKAEIPPFHTVAFPSDPGLQQLAAQTAQAVLQNHRVFCGRICSGDQFIAGEAAKRRIVSEFGGLCAEMEGAAIAQACTANALPFVIVRAISDRADASGGVSFAEFEASAAKTCASIVMKIIERYFAHKTPCSE